MKTLVINSYAGSLVLGAQAAGADIVGSYEDAAFGIGIQKANFPRLEFRDTRPEWPDKVKANIVLAHPPCSAFSVQTTSAKARGVGSAAFRCTKEVLDYAMGNKAEGIAVESVMGALGGAWDVHESFARTYGYHLYRIVKNSCLFGVPQWRERFWAVFVKKGAARPELQLGLRPNFTSVREALTGHMTGVAPEYKQRELERVHRRMKGDPVKWVERTKTWEPDDSFKPIRLTPKQMSALFDGPHDFTRPDGTPALGGLSFDRMLQKVVFPEMWADEKKRAKHLGDICKDYVTKFSSCQMLFVNPDGYVPVLLGSSFWYLNGKVLTERAYRVAMGFPHDYVFPEEDGYRKNMLTYLSKGVCPPVARWIHDSLARHLEGKDPVTGGYQRTVLPGQVAGFRIRRNDYPTNGTRPELRAEEWDNDDTE